MPLITTNEIKDMELVELIEHYEGGRVVKRVLNGVEFEADELPSAIQFAKYVTTKTLVTVEEAEQRYGTRYTAQSTAQQSQTGDPLPIPRE